METIIWIAALIAFAAIPYLTVYLVRRWKQARLERKWGLPQNNGEEPDSAEILGSTGVACFLDPWNKR